MNNFLMIGLGIAALGSAALAYDQHQKRKREQELFRREIADLRGRIDSDGQKFTDLSSRFVEKDEKVRVLLQENLSLKERDTETPWQTFA